MFNTKKGLIATALSDFYAVVILIIILFVFFFLFTFSSRDVTVTSEQLFYTTDASALGEQLLRSSVTVGDQQLSFSALLGEVYTESTAEQPMAAALTSSLQQRTSTVTDDGQAWLVTIQTGADTPFYLFGKELPVLALGVSGGGLAVHPSILSSAVFYIPRSTREPFRMTLALQCPALGSCTKKV